MVKISKRFDVLLLVWVVALRLVLYTSSSHTSNSCDDVGDTDIDIELSQVTKPMISNSGSSNNGSGENVHSIDKTRFGSLFGADTRTFKKIAMRCSIVLLVLTGIFVVVGLPIIFSRRNKNNNNFNLTTTAIPTSSTRYLENIAKELSTRNPITDANTEINDKTIDTVDDYEFSSSDIYFDHDNYSRESPRNSDSNSNGDNNMPDTSNADENSDAIINGEDDGSTGDSYLDNNNDIPEINTMTTEILPTLEAGEQCFHIGRKVYELIYDISPNVRDGTISLSTKDTNTINSISKKLGRIKNSSCEAGFFQLEEISNENVISFSSSNRYVSIVINEILTEMKCPEVARNVALILNELDLYTEEAQAYANIQNSKQKRNDLISNMDITKDLNCGDGFFTYTPHDNYLRIAYKPENEQIKAAWKFIFDDIACKETSEASVPILAELGLYTTDSSSYSVIENDNPKITDLTNALDAAIGHSCGDGFFSGIFIDDGLEVTYENSNQYISSVWEVEGPKVYCSKAAKDLVEYLVDLQLLTDGRSNVSTISSAYINAVNEKINYAENFNCGESFFSTEREGSSYKLDYDRNNAYVRKAMQNIAQALRIKEADETFTALHQVGYGLGGFRTSTKIYLDASDLRRLQDAMFIGPMGECGAYDFIFIYTNEYISLKYSERNPYIAAAQKKLLNTDN